MSKFILNPDIQQMLIHFYRISGIRVGVHDTDTTIITDYPPQSAEFGARTFCEKNQYCSRLYREACEKCDKTAFECAHVSGVPYIYKCRLGFMEAVIPISSGGETFCFLMIGQVRCSESKRGAAGTVAFVDNVFEQYNVPKEKYSPEAAYEDYERMPCMDFETFKSFVYFLELCAQKIHTDDYVRREQRSISGELMRYVKANLYNTVTIADFAKSVGFSTSYLSHSISKEMGTTFTNYLMRCRIEEAKRILRTTDMSVKKISLLLQYNDVAYFVRQFKKLTGMTCTQYRESKIGTGNKKYAPPNATVH